MTKKDIYSNIEYLIDFVQGKLSKDQEDIVKAVINEDLFLQQVVYGISKGEKYINNANPLKQRLLDSKKKFFQDLQERNAIRRHLNFVFGASIIIVIIFCALYYLSEFNGSLKPEVITNSTLAEQINIIELNGSSQQFPFVHNVIDSTIQIDEAETENSQADENNVSSSFRSQNIIAGSSESIIDERQTQPIAISNGGLMNNLNPSEDNFENSSPDYQIFAQNILDMYYQKDFPTSTLMSEVAHDSRENNLSKAAKSFLRREWVRSIDLFEQIPDLKKFEQEYFQLGVAYLQTGQLEKAIVKFKDLKEIYKWSDKAQWYLLLTYFSGGENYQSQFQKELQHAMQNEELDVDTKMRIETLYNQYLKVRGR